DTSHVCQNLRFAFLSSSFHHGRTRTGIRPSARLTENGFCGGAAYPPRRCTSKARTALGLIANAVRTTVLSSRTGQCRRQQAPSSTKARHSPPLRFLGQKTLE